MLLHRPWHRTLLAQPGPWREAIHCALLSSLICPSNLIATCLLLAASLAAGVIRPTLASKHIACALTAHVDLFLTVSVNSIENDHLCGVNSLTDSAL